MRKKTENKVLTVSTLVAINANEAFVAPVVESDGVCVNRKSWREKKRTWET